MKASIKEKIFDVFMVGTTEKIPDWLNGCHFRMYYKSTGKTLKEAQEYKKKPFEPVLLYAELDHKEHSWRVEIGDYIIRGKSGYIFSVTQEIFKEVFKLQPVEVKDG